MMNQQIHNFKFALLRRYADEVNKHDYNTVEFDYFYELFQSMWREVVCNCPIKITEPTKEEIDEYRRSRL